MLHSLLSDRNKKIASCFIVLTACALSVVALANEDKIESSHLALYGFSAENWNQLPKDIHKTDSSMLLVQHADILSDSFNTSSYDINQRIMNYYWLQSFHNPGRYYEGSKAARKIARQTLKDYLKAEFRSVGAHYIFYGPALEASSLHYDGKLHYRLRVSRHKARFRVEYHF